MTQNFQSDSRIFSWDQIERFEFEQEGNQTQIISGNNMHLLRAVFEPGAVYPMHSHPHEQFSVLLSGQILLTVGEEVREIGAGDGWYAGCHVPHGGKILGDEPAVSLMCIRPRCSGYWTISKPENVFRHQRVTLRDEDTPWEMR